MYILYHSIATSVLILHVIIVMYNRSARCPVKLTHVCLTLSRIKGVYIISLSWMPRAVPGYVIYLLFLDLNTFIRHVQETFGRLFPSGVDCNPLPSKLGMSTVLHEREV
jgi:hypothetical protein